MRSADFDYRDYIYVDNDSKEFSKDIKIVYLLPKKELENFKEYIVKEFYEYLIKKSEHAE